MRKTLDERLVRAKSVIDEITTVLGKQTATIPAPIVDQFQRSLEIAAGIEYWRELISARAAALQFLDGLETRVEHDDNVPMFVAPDGAALLKLRFSHVRLVGVEAYLSLVWSLADRITGMVGRVLCTVQGGAFQDQSPIKLISHFIQDDVGKGNPSNDDMRKEQAKSRRKSTAAIVSESIRLTYGYPVAVLYAIRNHFIHDGAQQQEVEFFESRASLSGFRISERGWSLIESKALAYGVGREYIRKGTAWPGSPRDDLRVLLTVCEAELDDALGVLVFSACQSLAFHIAAMVGAD